MRIEKVSPQPSKRLLPYADPLNGLFWAEAGEHPYESTTYKGPGWPNYTCVQLKEITGAQAARINGDWHCYGPACPGGDDGCNAKGCYGEREYLIKWLGGNPELWVWMELPEEPSK